MTTMRCAPPAGPVSATVRVPGSKSVANRALVCAMLADGTSRIDGLPDGDDTTVLVRVLEQASMASWDDGVLVIEGSPTVRLPGIVDCALAGTSSRFLTAVAALGAGTTLIDGEAPLRSRPMADLHDALGRLGAMVEPLGEGGHLPVSVHRGAISGGRLSIRSDVSSQFLSALMLIAPLLPGGLVLDLEGATVSRSYIEMTARVMSLFGVMPEVSESRIVVPQSVYVATDCTVEPDFSSAAFPIAAVLMRGGRVRIPGLAASREQGDAAILDIAEKLGAHWRVENLDLLVECPVDASMAAQDAEFSMSDCSDLVPAVAVALSVRPGRWAIGDVGFIRHKESDRLGDVARELRSVGLSVTDTADGLRIDGNETVAAGVMGTHHDHRLAMAFALLSLNQPGIAVADPDVVTKSWPSYFADMVDILGDSRRDN